MKFYYLNHLNVEVGPILPFEFSALVKSGDVQADTLVRQEDQTEYVIYSSLSEEMLSAQAKVPQALDSSENYFYEREDEVYGPYGLKQLKKAVALGVISKETPVCPEHSESWTPLHKTELHRLLEGDNASKSGPKKRRLQLKPKNSGVTPPPVKHPVRPEPAAPFPEQKVAKAESPQIQYTPVTIGNWILTFVICSIPLVGLCANLYWTFSSKTHPSKQTWFRAGWVMIGFIVAVGAAIPALQTLQKVIIDKYTFDISYLLFPALLIGIIAWFITRDSGKGLYKKDPEDPKSSLYELQISISDWLFANFMLVIPVANLAYLIYCCASLSTKPSKKSWAAATLIFIGSVVILSVALYLLLIVLGVAPSHISSTSLIGLE
ncbi:MAG: DUF4339 domain-containing protein [Opitutales bacterium]